jgi:hypothetical protein
MVSILIVNWNLTNWIDKCVKKTLEHPPKEDEKTTIRNF